MAILSNRYLSRRDMEKGDIALGRRESGHVAARRRGRDWGKRDFIHNKISTNASMYTGEKKK